MVFHYALITAGDLWLEMDPMHHGSFNCCDFPLCRVFVQERDELSKEDTFHNWDGDGAPTPGRAICIVDKMNLLRGGHIVTQYKSKEPAWSELEGSQMQEKVPLRQRQ